MNKKLKGMIADLCVLLGDVLEELAAETAPPAEDRPARGSSKEAEDDPAPARRGKGKKGPSIDDVRDKLTDLANEKGRPATIKMLKSFKASTVDDLDESDYQEIIDAIDDEIRDTGDEDEGKGKFDVDEDEDKPARGRRASKDVDEEEEEKPARRGRPAGKSPARRGTSRR